MTLNLSLPVTQHTDFSPRITVIGVGGGGTNAVNNMITMGLDGVDFVVANTDAQALVHSRAERRVQLGPHLTQGLGAGAKPEIGRAAAEEATEELTRHLEGSHMVFITAGMGGGTGTGAAPVIARMARERGILTVGVVTRPFDFEGKKRRDLAEVGIDELQGVVDTLIIIPNQNLFRLANERTTFVEAFKMADNVLYMGVRGVTDLMVNPGVVNLDFADIRTVMAEMGKAMMGTGEAEGDDRAVKASEAAISNPLLEDTSMQGARGVLINITGGHDMTLFEVDEAANRIRKEVDEDANIIFGSSIDETMNGRLRVSVVATGIDMAQMAASAQATSGKAGAEGLTVLAGGRAAGAGTAAPMLAAAGGGGRPAMMGAPGAPAVAVRRPAGGPAAVLRAAASHAAAGAPMQPTPYPSVPQGMGQGMGQGTGPVAMTPASNGAEADPAARFGGGEQGLAAAAPLHQQAAPVASASAAAGGFPVGGGGLRNLFRHVTGASGLMRRNLGDTPPPVAPRIEPSPGAPQAPSARAAAPRATQQDEMGLDIPTFLRRQTN